MVTVIPCCVASSYAASTAAGDSSHQLIQTPPVSSSPTNCGIGPPRDPCAPWQRKISDLPLQTAPNVGGSPQSHAFSQPSFENHSKLSTMLETLSIGVCPSIFITASQ